MISFQEVVFGAESLDELLGAEGHQERHQLSQDCEDASGSGSTGLPAKREYQQHLAPVQIQNKAVWASPDPRFIINGNAIATDKSIFSSESVISHQLLHLSAVRNCQMLKLKNPSGEGAGNLVFVNTHLHHPIPEIDEHIRAHQIS